MHVRFASAEFARANLDGLVSLCSTAFVAPQGAFISVSVARPQASFRPLESSVSDHVRSGEHVATRETAPTRINLEIRARRVSHGVIMKSAARYLLTTVGLALFAFVALATSENNSNCGHAGQGCCVQRWCEGELVCNEANTCAERPAAPSCGAAGQSCCEGSGCTAPLVCNSGQCGTPPPATPTCGRAGQLCCKPVGRENPSRSDWYCHDNLGCGLDGHCAEVCGGLNQVCCGETCSGTDMQPMDCLESRLCANCGATGQPCCQNDGNPLCIKDTDSCQADTHKCTEHQNN
jgi:hypothetical protein